MHAGIVQIPWIVVFCLWMRVLRKVAHIGPAKDEMGKKKKNEKYQPNIVNHPITSALSLARIYSRRSNENEKSRNQLHAIRWCKVNEEEKKRPTHSEQWNI